MNSWKEYRIGLIVFILFMVLLHSFPSLAVEKIIIRLSIGSHEATINNNAYILEVAPFLYHQRTMVPLRFIGEALDSQVEWIPNPQIVGEGMILLNMSQIRKRIKLHTRVPYVFVEEFSEINEISVKCFMLDAEPYIIKPQNRAVVPLRFISEAFGAEVIWNASDRSIMLIYHPYS